MEQQEKTFIQRYGMLLSISFMMIVSIIAAVYAANTAIETSAHVNTCNEHWITQIDLMCPPDKTYFPGSPDWKPINVSDYGASPSMDS